MKDEEGGSSNSAEGRSRQRAAASQPGPSRGTRRSNRAVPSAPAVPFRVAREIVRQLGLEEGSRAAWAAARRAGRLPRKLPQDPERAYASRGWLGWPDFLLGPSAAMLHDFRQVRGGSAAFLLCCAVLCSVMCLAHCPFWHCPLTSSRSNPKPVKTLGSRIKH